jgi:hypothetical protein
MIPDLNGLETSLPRTHSYQKVAEENEEILGTWLIVIKKSFRH